VAGDKSLKEAFKEAAAIASVVPESMQEGAFHRALDEILGDSGGSSPGEGSPRGAPRKRRPRRETGVAKQDDSVDDLVAKINRTEHPEINDSMPVLERSLSILLIAKNLGIDGLSPPRIAEILTDKFRVKTRRQHVGAHLSSATKFVDRHKEGRGFSYRIMGAGEKHLEDFNGRGGQSSTGASSRKAPPKRAPRKRAPSKESKPKGDDKPKRGTRSRPGPKAVIESLIQAGFFKDPKTISNIQDHLKTKVGHFYKPTDLSPALTRLLRDGQLDRDRNESGKYEYQQS
jgi:hypothetical protein